MRNQASPHPSLNVFSPRAQTRAVPPWALMRLGIVMLGGSLLAACTTGSSGEDDDDVSPTPFQTFETPTPAATPVPIVVKDGTWSLNGIYLITVTLKGTETSYVLNPQGYASTVDGTVMGSITWTVYASKTDYPNSPLCTYVENITGDPDSSIYPSVGCVNCGIYYTINLTPPGETTCDASAIQAILDSNSDGQVSDKETTHADQWGFSDLSGGQYPPAWTELSSWDPTGANGEDLFGLKDSLECYDVPYAIWSRQWHTSSAAYLPLYATYPSPLPSGCLP